MKLPLKVPVEFGTCHECIGMGALVVRGAKKGAPLAACVSLKKMLVGIDVSDLLRQPRAGCPQRVRAVSSLGQGGGSCDVQGGGETR